MFGRGIWSYWDNIFNFYPVDAFWDSISAINSVWANFGTQNTGVLGGFVGYGLQYVGSVLGLSVLAQNRLIYILPWLLRGIGMFILLSTIDKSNSNSSLVAKLCASVLYQFAPSGDPFSDNIMSITTGTAPIALAIFIKGMNSSKWYKYAILFSIWFSFAATTFYSVVFIPTLIILYTLVISLRSGYVGRNVSFLVVCLVLSFVSMSYFVIPFLYYNIHSSSLANVGINPITLDPNITANQQKLQSLTFFASRNSLTYSIVGLEYAWAWFPIYTQPLFYFSLALTTVIAYSTLLIRKNRNTLFLAILGVIFIALSTTITYPYFKDFYRWGLYHFYAFFADPVYFVYGIWFASSALLGLGSIKLFSILSRQKRRIFAAVLIGVIVVDSFPMATGTLAEYTVSPITGYPIPPEYYQLYSLLSSAEVGSRLLEVPLPNYDFTCYGPNSPGFVWSGSPGCFNTWLSKIVPRQIETIQDKVLLQPIGYQAVYDNLRAGNLGSREEQELMENLNLKYIFVHKDLVEAPSWVNQLILELNQNPTFSLVTSNKHFNLYEVGYHSSPLYVVSGADLQPVNGSLQGYWPFDEGSGALTYDLSGNHYNGALNSLTWQSGPSCKFNGCLNFSGSAYVSIPSSLRITGTGLTLSSWVYTPSFSTDAGVIMGNDIPADQNLGVMLSLSKDASHVYFALGFGSSHAIFTPSYPFESGKWYMITATYDGSQMIVYVNGKSIGNTRQAGSIALGSASLRFGQRTDGLQPLFGKLDEVRVYNRALTATEVGILYRYSPINLESTISTARKTSVRMLESSLSEWNALIDISTPSALILTQVFSDQWRAYIDGHPLPESSHFLANDYANGWHVNITGTHSLSIRHEAQPYFYLGAWISGVYWIVSATLIVLVFLRNGKDRYNFRKILNQRKVLQARILEGVQRISWKRRRWYSRAS
ncbi:MAG: hypothetical protein M1503_09975 [Thaumarchaeota archaeon]|nr:hypothetical protein [Nitrososphaerota archaeon]